MAPPEQLGSWRTYFSGKTSVRRRTRLRCTGQGSNPGGVDIFRACLDRPWGPPSFLYNVHRVFPGGKAAGTWYWPSTHFYRRCCELILIYLLTAIGLSPGGSMHLHTDNTRNNTNNNRKTQITTNVGECRQCPVFAGICFTTAPSLLVFALQLRKKHGKTSVRVRETTCVNALRTRSFKLFKRPFPGILTILTL